MPILDSISQANDIKKVLPNDYDKLAAELRRFLMNQVSITGGHLAANLGVVELTMALHLFLDFPEDKLIWDVGHQSYIHKILTGRKNQFGTLRQFNGLSGYPKRSESNCDSFDTGHSSTSISAALGYARARDLKGDTNKVVSVIGDGALTGGLAFEALNNAGRLKTNMIIVLNDNNMSISENVGAMSSYLGRIRTNVAYMNFKGDLENALNKLPKIGTSITRTLKRSKDSIKQLLVPGMLFENMGITYIGPIDGHNIEQMESAFLRASLKNNATLVHVVTQKGKGFKAAELNPSKYHAIEPFDKITGECLNKQKAITYTDVFSEAIYELGKEDKKIVAITAAMKTGTGLTKFADTFPTRFYDVGIAEEHAVTFAAGMAAAGYKPVVAVYSTFLQRAYDQVLHDVCLGQLPVIFAIDRAGIVGSDGETHQGIFDISYLSHIPGLTILAPKNQFELKEMFRYALTLNAPVAIRYPRMPAFARLEEFDAPIEYGKSEVLYHKDASSDIALFAVGNTVETAVKVKLLLEENQISTSVINVRFINPIDFDTIAEFASKCKILVTLEENVKQGGFGERVSVYLFEHDFNSIKHINVSLPNQFLVHGSIDELRKLCGIDAESVATRIIESIKLL